MDKQFEKIEDFYNNEIQDELIELNKLRKNNLKKGILNQCILVGLILAFFIRSYLRSEEGLSWDDLLVIFYIVLPFAIVVFTLKPYKFLLDKAHTRFIAHYKFNIIKEYMLRFDENVSYFSSFKTSIPHLLRSGLLGNKISENYEKDGIVGEISGLHYRVSQIKLMKGIRTFFSGVIIILRKDEWFNVPVEYYDHNLGFTISCQSEVNTQILTTETEKIEIANQILNDFRLNYLGKSKVSMVDDEIFIVIEREVDFFKITYKPFVFQQKHIKEDLLFINGFFQMIKNLSEIK